MDNHPLAWFLHQDEHGFWDAVMCRDRLAEAGAAEPVIVLCPALLGDIPSGEGGREA